MKADKRKDPSILSTMATNLRFVRTYFKPRTHGIIIIHSFKLIYFRFAECLLRSPPPAIKGL